MLLLYPGAGGFAVEQIPCPRFIEDGLYQGQIAVCCRGRGAGLYFVVKALYVMRAKAADGPLSQFSIDMGNHLRPCSGAQGRAMQFEVLDSQGFERLSIGDAVREELPLSDFCLSFCFNLLG